MVLDMTHRMTRAAVVVSLAAWGPATWFALHSMAHSRPERSDAADARRFLDFLSAFATYLPCRRCSKHMQAYLARVASPPRTREECVALVNALHNSVNARNGKHVWTLDEHYRWMRVHGGAPPRSSSSHRILAFAFAAILLLVVAKIVHA